MKKKGTFVSLFMALILFIFSERTVFAAEAINEIVAPTGVKAFLVLIPLVLVLVLLFKKVDMIIAGLIAGILAMIIGGISLAEANSQLLE
ncbi:citrate transporter, partial [Enterococcus faecalis]|nr:citrate transporter [Enterococcus faecalis]